MTYDSNIPLPTQSLGQTQSQINENFADIDTRFSLNHITFNDAGGGKHKKVVIPEWVDPDPAGPATEPVPTTAANEGALYTKEQDSITSLFWRQESDGTEIQMTGPDPLIAATGYTFLPGGLILQWGSAGAVLPPPTTVTTVTFPLPFPTAVYSVTASPYYFQQKVDGLGQIRIAATLTEFEWWNVSNVNYPVYWMAIGN